MLDAIRLYFLPCLINIVTAIYVLSVLLNEKINLKSIKFYLSIVFLIIIAIINFVYVNYIYRLAIITFFVSLINYIIFRKNIKTTIISSLIEQILAVISESIVTVLILIFFSYNASEIINNFYGSIVTNFLISIIMIIIVKNKIVNDIYMKVINVTTNLNIKLLIYSTIILIFTINIIFFCSFNSDRNLFYINLIFIIMYIMIFYLAMSQKDQNLKVKEENKNLLNNLNEYEKMLDYQRVNNHENKNQLLVIKSMIEKNDIKIIDYINEIIKEKREDNEIIYTKAKRIPSGGLQGLIYQKMLLMQEKNIEIVLDISTEVRKIDLQNISSKMNYDICRIIGIILDNAIEETIKFNKNDREITISMYVDELFYIEISNRVKENIDINKISEKGYTTKNGSHGYGLSLLNKIVLENKDIFNEIKIVNGIFTQVIKIKM